MRIRWRCPALHRLPRAGRSPATGTSRQSETHRCESPNGAISPRAGCGSGATSARFARSRERRSPREPKPARVSTDASPGGAIGPRHSSGRQAQSHAGACASHWRRSPAGQPALGLVQDTVDLAAHLAQGRTQRLQRRQIGRARPRPEPAEPPGGAAQQNSGRATCRSCSSPQPPSGHVTGMPSAPIGQLIETVKSYRFVSFPDAKVLRPDRPALARTRQAGARLAAWTCATKASSTRRFSASGSGRSLRPSAESVTICPRRLKIARQFPPPPAGRGLAEVSAAPEGRAPRQRNRTSARPARWRRARSGSARRGPVRRAGTGPVAGKPCPTEARPPGARPPPSRSAPRAWPACRDAAPRHRAGIRCRRGQAALGPVTRRAPVDAIARWAR